MFGNKSLDKNNTNKSLNPFLEECTNCISDIWSILKEKTSELDKKCYPNTYVWIEKFKDDNY